MEQAKTFFFLFGKRAEMLSYSLNVHQLFLIFSAQQDNEIKPVFFEERET